MGISEKMLQELQNVNRKLDELFMLISGQKKKEGTPGECFYPGCSYSDRERKCECGDHSYGPEIRGHGEWMCKKHSQEHGYCAGYGNW